MQSAVEKIMRIYESMDLTELATEAVTAAKDSQRQLTSSVQNAITAGRYLVAAKSKVEHGQWSSWVSQHWEGDGRTARTAQRYMTLANFDGDLSDVESLRDALSIVADAKNDTRVVFAEKPTIPEITREEIDASDYQPFAKPEPRQLDDDPTPRPESTTVHSEASRKIAEDDKPRTQPVAVEPQRDEAVYSLTELKMALSNVQKTVVQESQRKKVAKELRATADKLDPQKYPTPSVEDVEAYANGNGWSGFNSEKFHNHYELADWKYGKSKTPLKKWKIAAGQAWDNGNGWCAQGGSGGDPW